MGKELIAKISVIFHFSIMMLLVFVPFAIPLNIWPSRPLWHFIFLTIILLLGFITAAWHRKKYNSDMQFICFLNLITQKIRGYNLSDSRNYEYSHFRDILKKFKIKVPRGISLISLVIIMVWTLFNFIKYLLFQISFMS